MRPPGAVGFVALTLDVATSTSFIDFGAFTAFTFLNIPVIATWVRGRRTDGAGDGSGAGGRGVLGHVVAPLIGAAIDVRLLVHLDSRALEPGAAWLVPGIAHLAWRTRLLRRPAPATDFSEEDPELANAA